MNYEHEHKHLVNIIKADEKIDPLVCTDKKKPHMWWEEFEKQLTAVFAAYDKREKRQVYSDEMKISILIKKINADFYLALRLVLI